MKVSLTKAGKVVMVVVVMRMCGEDGVRVGLTVLETDMGDIKKITFHSFCIIINAE